LSVYTTVGRAELAAWLEPLQLGALTDFAGIAAGMQNSNYFVTAGGVRRVLTVFEHQTPAQLDFYLALMAHLSARGIPCPQPLADRDGMLWRPLAGKPAALLSCLPGSAVESPTAEQCAVLGADLADAECGTAAGGKGGRTAGEEEGASFHENASNAICQPFLTETTIALSIGHLHLDQNRELNGQGDEIDGPSADALSHARLMAETLSGSKSKRNTARQAETGQSESEQDEFRFHDERAGLSTPKHSPAPAKDLIDALHDPIGHANLYGRSLGSFNAASTWVICSAVSSRSTVPRSSSW
jgi:hypothetical protein